MVLENDFIKVSLEQFNLTQEKNKTLKFKIENKNSMESEVLEVTLKGYDEFNPNNRRGSGKSGIYIFH